MTRIIIVTWQNEWTCRIWKQKFRVLFVSVYSKCLIFFNCLFSCSCTFFWFFQSEFADKISFSFHISFLIHISVHAAVNRVTATYSFFFSEKYKINLWHLPHFNVQPWQSFQVPPLTAKAIQQVCATVLIYVLRFFIFCYLQYYFLY
jgi:hypothetical protein